MQKIVFGSALVLISALVAPFSPAQDEIAWARGILASAADASSEGRGAYARDGEMVDEAVVKRARRILRDAAG